MSMFTTGFYNRFIKIWKTDTFGYFAVAMMLIAVFSGILLAPAYDAGRARESLSLILLGNPAASFLRNMHYWSAQLFLVFTLLHIWEHFIKATEKKVRRVVWLRLSVGLLSVFYVMISGFILKGDADALQADRIIRTLFSHIPLAGPYISDLFIGDEGGLQLLYVHHIATATIFLFIILYDHSGIIWGKARTFLYALSGIVILSLFITPQLKTVYDPVVRGPWYFLAFQEILHLLTQPMWAVAGLALLLLIFSLLPGFRPPARQKIKSMLTATVLAYALLTLFAFFFRGENWQLTGISSSTIRQEFYVGTVFAGNDSLPPPAAVQGRYEGCISCHDNISGFSPAHSPQALGCYACHRGNPFTLGKDAAHEDMILIPGNMNNARLTCGTSSCHPGIHERVESSLMNRLSGMIAVNRFVFDESDSPDDSLISVHHLGYSAADKHLRQLCVSCHLGKEKTSPGPVDMLSRGGGCNACHLNYDTEARRQLADTTLTLKTRHPALDINISDEHCLGCHSRSGRISLNYRGLHETTLSGSQMPDTLHYTLLADGRVVKHVAADIHFEKGLSCIDCHISYETMGDGRLYAHKEEQTVVRCEDCHTNRPRTKEYDAFDAEERRIFNLRAFQKPGRTVLATKKDNRALLNAFAAAGDTFLVTKIGNLHLPLKKPADTCTRGEGHRNVDCATCHSAWVPQCIGCHTRFRPEEKSRDHLSGKDMPGRWEEYVGEFMAEPPTLGVRETKNGARVIPVAPGMVLTIDKKDGAPTLFKRLFAPAAPHTVSREGRDCQSCHFNPLALGYGRGRFTIRAEGRRARIVFSAEYENREEDGLPEDAWIGFMENVREGRATRSNIRPLNPDEQKRILEVGLCLDCHKKDSAFTYRLPDNYPAMKAGRSSQCLTLKTKSVDRRHD